MKSVLKKIYDFFYSRKKVMCCFSDIHVFVLSINFEKRGVMMSTST